MKEYQIRLLKSKICLEGLDITSFCKICGTTKQNLYNKINGTRDFKLNEVKKIKKILCLNMEEVEKIFFE